VKKQKYPHLLGSKWTAAEPAFGWRHFQVLNRQTQGDQIFAEMEAACDPKVRFWLNAKLLKQRHLWRSGWQPLVAEVAAEAVAEVAAGGESG
jgi:tryptophan-rich hypothetical protein